MGYELHIERKADYSDYELESNITFTEWQEYVASDPELKLTNGFETVFPGTGSNWQEAPGFSLWMNHPENAEPWFDFGFGTITAKNPDKPTTEKMIKIASALNARLIGDNGELYDERYFENGGIPIFEEEDENNDH